MKADTEMALALMQSHAPDNIIIDQIVSFLIEIRRLGCSCLSHSRTRPQLLGATAANETTVKLP